MKKLFKQVGYFLIIVTLLPYVITVFINGKGITVGQDGSSPYVTVKRKDAEQKLPLDEYGTGILAKEIKADADEEALKAQAILIRTSIYKTIQEKGSSTVLTKKYWTRSQMETNWGKDVYAENYEKLRNAWDETEGKVLMYNGSLALTPYHKLSNGKTRAAGEVFGDGAYPYLQVKDCGMDIEAEDAMMTTLIQGTDMEVTKTDSAGYVTEVRCGTEMVGGEEFRDTYHLASACFVLQDYEGQIRVTTKGVGHGLGMSQYTAEKMAEDGKTFEEILNYFFDGTTIEEVAEIITI